MFQCPQCDKSYQRKAHLRRHEVTHTGQAATACPFCGKFFLKPEVTRRHSKACAIKHNQQPAGAGKPGRKRQSCQQCLSSKRACDKGSPCSRCRLLGLQCTFESQQVLSSANSNSIDLSTLPPVHPPRSSKDSSLFPFLRHFTDPSRDKDRLAIGTTAECSVRRNLETLYSHIQDALIPLDSMAVWYGDLSGSGSLFLPSSSSDDCISTNFLSSGPGATKLEGQLNELKMDVVETSKSMELDGSGTMQLPLNSAQLAPLLRFLTWAYSSQSSFTRSIGIFRLCIFPHLTRAMFHIRSYSQLS
ncbi:hypothetical protein BDW66DRAFT_34596 [Aspergillus desertorum]